MDYLGNVRLHLTDINDFALSSSITENLPPEETTSALGQSIKSELMNKETSDNDRYAEYTSNKRSSPVKFSGWPFLTPAERALCRNNGQRPWIIGEVENVSYGEKTKEYIKCIRDEMEQDWNEILSEMRSINLLQNDSPQGTDTTNLSEEKYFSIEMTNKIDINCGRTTSKFLSMFPFQ